MGYDKVTVATYDTAAEQFADYFKGYGTRVQDIETAFRLAGNPQHARVIEIGCGDGRDAAAIVKYAEWYEGFDPSAGLLRLARQRKLNGRFVEADALSYDYRKDVDIVFAFASLLHISREELKVVFRKVHNCLRENGIIFLSLKERSAYEKKFSTTNSATDFFISTMFRLC